MGQRAAGDGVGQGRICVAVGLRLRRRSHRDRPLRDHELVRHEGDDVVVTGGHRAPGDVVAADAIAGCSGERSGELIGADEVRHLVGQRRVRLAVGLGLGVGRHRDGSGNDVQGPADEGHGVVVTRAERALADGVAPDVLTRRAGQAAGEGVRADEGAGGDGRRQAGVGVAVGLALVLGGDGDGLGCDGQVRPGVGQRVVAASRQGALRDGERADAGAGRAGQRAGEAVSGDERASRDAVRQLRVVLAVDHALGSCGDSDRPLADRQLGADEAQRVVAPQVQAALRDGVAGHVLTGSAGKGAGEAVAPRQRSAGDLVGEDRVRGAVDLGLCVRRHRDGAGGDLQHAVDERQRVVGARGQRALSDRVAAHGLTRIADHAARQGVRPDQVALSHRGGQLRVGCAVGLALAVRGHRDGALGDRQRARRHRQRVVRTGRQRALRDGVGADPGTGSPRERAGEGVALSKRARGDLIGEVRVVVAVGLGLVSGGHGERPLDDRQVAADEVQRVVAVDGDGALADGVLAGVLTSRPDERT